MRLQAVHRRILLAALAAGRPPSEIRFIAVSKTRPSQDLREAYAEGQIAFAESYVQEGVKKIAELHKLPLEWHFIGPIQSNKTRLIAENFDWVHSVDRLKIAERLAEARPTDKNPLQVCVQVNISKEPTKQGVDPDSALELIRQIASLPQLRVRGLMASDKLFDITQESAKVRDLYGRTQFGEQALIARRLIEAGVPFVRVARAWWDSHGQNFETHQEMVPELDQVMAALVDDLKDRGLLEHTLILTLAEFGRTPGINPSLGRDHFGSAWSCSLTGTGIKPGAYGKTDATGNKVVEGETDAAKLFATIYSALGMNPHKNYYLGSRPVPLAPRMPAPGASLASCRATRAGARASRRRFPAEPRCILS